jgi:hypothetical protein
MPSVLFSPRSPHAILRKTETMNSRSDEPIPCYGEEIPCSPREQGIGSKTLGLLREMAVRLAKMVKKEPRFRKFPCSFPCIQGIRAGGEANQAVVRGRSSP